MFGRRVSSFSKNLTYSKRDLAMITRSKEGLQFEGFQREWMFCLLMNWMIDRVLFDSSAHCHHSSVSYFKLQLVWDQVSETDKDVTALRG